MERVRFPEPFRHEHPPVRNVNELVAARTTFGERAADWVSTKAGTWHFIIAQSVLLAVWVAVNVVAFVRHWDPYPFILMNLLLSLQAAYTAPIILMSQNRQAERDRIEAHNDFLINQKAEEEIRAVLEHLAAQDRALGAIQQALDELRRQRD